VQYDFRFKIKPQVKERPRFGRGHAYTSSKTRAFENEIVCLAKRQWVNKPPLDKPLSCVITFYLERPKTTKLLAPKPDVDNYCKALLDSLNEVLFKDDSQIVELYAKKAWAEESLILLSLIEI